MVGFGTVSGQEIFAWNRELSKLVSGVMRDFNVKKLDPPVSGKKAVLATSTILDFHTLADFLRFLSMTFF